MVVAGSPASDSGVFEVEVARWRPVVAVSSITAVAVFVVELVDLGSTGGGPLRSAVLWAEMPVSMAVVALATAGMFLRAMPARLRVDETGLTLPPSRRSRSQEGTAPAGPVHITWGSAKPNRFPVPGIYSLNVRGRGRLVLIPGDALRAVLRHPSCLWTTPGAQAS